MYILTTGINETRGWRVWSDKPLEGLELNGYTLGKTFRYLQEEYGRCTGKMYRDRPDGSPVQVGWVFQKTARYSDTKEPYIQEVWVEVLKAKPTVTVTKESVWGAS